jgi:transketolase
MRLLPHMMVVAPGDPHETRLAVTNIVRSNVPCYLRLGKANEPTVHKQLDEMPVGKCLQLRDGHDIALISTGGVLPECDQAADQIDSKGHSTRLLSMPYLAPVDTTSIIDAARQTRGVITVEEHGTGGLASIVAELMATNRCNTPLVPLYVTRDQDHTVGDQTYLRKLHGLDANAITQRALQLLVFSQR